MVKKYKIKQKISFIEESKKIAKYIRNKSPQNATKFTKELGLKLLEIKQNPKAFPVESYLETKNNVYRFALVMKSWKIIYKTTNNIIVIIGIIHTARHPNEIRKLRTTNYK